MCFPKEGREKANAGLWRLGGTFVFPVRPVAPIPTFSNSRQDCLKPEAFSQSCSRSETEQSLGDQRRNSSVKSRTTPQTVSLHCKVEKGFQQQGGGAARPPQKVPIAKKKGSSQTGTGKRFCRHSKPLPFRSHWKKFLGTSTQLARVSLSKGETKASSQERSEGLGLCSLSRRSWNGPHNVQREASIVLMEPHQTEGSATLLVASRLVSKLPQKPREALL
jgi:hypothetical protein